MSHWQKQLELTSRRSTLDSLERPSGSPGEVCPTPKHVFICHVLLLHVVAGNISTLKANVDTSEVEKSVLEQIEAMAKKHAGKHSNTDINPYITFTVREIDFE